MYRFIVHALLLGLLFTSSLAAKANEKNWQYLSAEPLPISTGYVNYNGGGNIPVNGSLAYIIFSRENGPLLNGSEETSRPIYPLPEGAKACSDRGCLNGCTVGFGFNLGAFTEEDVKAYMQRAKIGGGTIKKFLPFAGKTGVDALALCGDEAENLPTLSAQESQSLGFIMIAKHQKHVYEALRDYFPDADLSTFPLAVFNVLVALDYQSRALVSVVKTNFITAAVEENWDTFFFELLCNSGSQKKGANSLKERRLFEAEYAITALGLSLERLEISCKDGQELLLASASP